MVEYLSPRDNATEIGEKQAQEFVLSWCEVHRLTSDSYLVCVLVEENVAGLEHPPFELPGSPQRHFDACDEFRDPVVGPIRRAVPIRHRGARTSPCASRTPSR